MTMSINPQQMTNAAGTFYKSSKGGWQGMFMADPAIRNELKSGIVAPTQTAPLWGGMAITESLPTTGAEASEVGSVLALATDVANLTGFTVFDQSHAMINSPESPVPLASGGGGNGPPALPGGAINFFETGTGARIWVACSQAVANSLSGGVVNPVVYWDYTNQVLLTSGTDALSVKVVGVDTSGNTPVVVYSGGLATWNYSGFGALIQI
jgi:hypothetical protein